MWELDYKESWALKNWCFWTVVLEKTLESPLDCKESQPVHPKGDQSWVFTGRTDAEAEAPIHWLPHMKSWLIRKDPDAGRDWGQEEKGTTEDEMAGWHHRLDGHEFEWTQRVGDGQGGLACCSSWGCKESDTTEQLNWTELTLFLSQDWIQDTTPYLGTFLFRGRKNKGLPNLLLMRWETESELTGWDELPVKWSTYFQWVLIEHLTYMLHYLHVFLYNVYYNNSYVLSDYMHWLIASSQNSEVGVIVISVLWMKAPSLGELNLLKIIRQRVSNPCQLDSKVQHVNHHEKILLNVHYMDISVVQLSIAVQQTFPKLVI